MHNNENQPNQIWVNEFFLRSKNSAQLRRIECEREKQDGQASPSRGAAPNCPLWESVCSAAGPTTSYYTLLQATTTSYSEPTTSSATILSPSLAASAPSELCLDPAPLNLKALCYMISLNLNQVMTLAYDSLLIATAPFQSTAILRIMTLVLQMIHAMGPSLSWFCTAFRFQKNPVTGYKCL